jgi:DnaJ-class molecular chaperone
MRTVTAAAAVALAATTSTSEASSSVSVPIFIPLNSLETRGGASFPDNDKTPHKAPRRANKKKKKSTKNPSRASEIPNNTEKESQEPIAQEEDGPSEPPKPTSPSPQETLIEELLGCDDYYSILGVSKTATATQIQKAYRKRAVQTHPDKVPNNDRRAFDKVAEAYDVLSDDTKRATYDRFGKRGLDPTAEGRPPSSFTEDLFKNFFAPQYRSPFQQQPRNRNVRYQLEVTLEELYNGVDKNVIVTDPGRKKVHVSIDKGMHSGQAIVLSGEMDHIQDATPADLIFVLQQRPHPHFTRKGHDLAMELTISLQEAVCGMTRTIRHLDGRLVSISSAKDADDMSILIHTGDVQVLKGEGMPKPGERGAHGDLYVQYKVEMPTQEAVNTLTNEEREQLGKLLGKLEGDTYYQRLNANDNHKSTRLLQKASPADFGRASGPFRVETEDFEYDAGKRGFPFGAGQRHFHFSSGTASSFFGGAFGGGRPHDTGFDDDEGRNVQCQQM